MYKIKGERSIASTFDRWKNIRPGIFRAFATIPAVSSCRRSTWRRRFAARAERAATAREARAADPENNGSQEGPGPAHLAEAALLLAAALFDVKHQLESWRTRPFRYRPKGRTDRVDIAPELQGELNLWIADWPEWESLLDSVERNDPSLIAVRPHVPSPAQIAGSVHDAATRDPAGDVGRSGDGAARGGSAGDR